MRPAHLFALAPLALAACSAPQHTAALSHASAHASAHAPAPSRTAASPATGATLRVEVTGADLADGPVRVEVYDSAAAFDGEAKPARVAAVPPSGGRVSLTFKDLPAGSYAVRAYQDRDRDGTCTVDRGKPVEPFAFSNDDGQPLTALPTFEDARFDVGRSEKKVTLRIRPAS